MNKEVQIIELKLDGSVEIHDHPRQKEIYSDKIDNDFVESIKMHGVKEMPIIAPAENIIPLELIDPAKDNVVIISGHRRIRVSQKIGSKSITSVVREYNNVFDSEVDHLVSNKQREKKPSEINAEINAYKQKLSQIRKELEIEGVSVLDKYKSMQLKQYVKFDENGRPYLPYSRELIEKELKIKKKKQQQLYVIFPSESHNWLQDRLDDIHHSILTPKSKREATEKLSKFVEKVRHEVDKKDALSVNKGYNEILGAWKEIDSVINPKPKEKTKKKKKDVTQKWLKAKDFAEKMEGEQLLDAEYEELVDVLEGQKEIIIAVSNDIGYKINLKLFSKFLKEQGV